jgi:hypothetical protein
VLPWGRGGPRLLGSFPIQAIGSERDFELALQIDEAAGKVADGHDAFDLGFAKVGLQGGNCPRGVEQQRARLRAGREVAVSVTSLPGGSSPAR